MRTILITGTSSGLGEYLAYKLVKEGNRVIGISRSPITPKSKLQNFLDKSYFHKVINLRNREEILNLPNTLSSEISSSISAVISNAGIYGPLGKLSDIDIDEFVDSIEVNLISPFLIAKTFIPIICSNNHKRPKFIQISGGGATKPMFFALSYAASKSGVVRLIESISQEYKNKCDINSIAPGLLNTKLLDQILEAGSEKVGLEFYENMKSQKITGGTDMIKTFNLVEFLLSKKSDGITGKLISAVWDEYISWPEKINKLNESDIYTLTRKV